MILPALLMAILSTTSIIQYLRSEIIDNTNQDFVKTARSKGVSEKMVFWKHILRNSLLPIAAFFGYSITGLLGGSIFWKRFLAILEWGCCLWTRSLVAITLLSRHLSCCMVC